MKTLIIIDDELFFRKSICSLIKKQENYEIIGEANNGASGAEMIRELKPDIALVDISMPVMDGLEMIRSLVSDCRTKFILSTGYNDFAYAKQAITLGVKEYLLKPVDNRELLDCLDKLSQEIDGERRRQGVISDYYQTR
ncbi:response regulator, partial [Blautia pseudococcoides]|nr:response regulator [Blautia pseudococcoides]